MSDLYSQSFAATTSTEGILADYGISPDGCKIVIFKENVSISTVLARTPGQQANIVRPSSSRLRLLYNQNSIAYAYGLMFQIIKVFGS